MSYLSYSTIAQAWALRPPKPNTMRRRLAKSCFPLGNFLIYACIIDKFALPLVRDFLRSRREEVVDHD